MKTSEKCHLTVAAPRPNAANSKRLNSTAFCQKPLRWFYTAVWLGALLCSPTGINLATAQSTTNPPVRPIPPTRDPHTPGFVMATELPDGTVPPVDTDGNFIIGPTHNRAPEMIEQTTVPPGTV